MRRAMRIAVCGLALATGGGLSTTRDFRPLPASLWTAVPVAASKQASSPKPCADPMAIIKAFYDANDASRFDSSLALFTEDATFAAWAEGINGHHMDEVHLTGKARIRPVLGKQGLRRISGRPDGLTYHEARVQVMGDRVTFMLEPDRLRPNGRLYSPYHVEAIFDGCKIKSLTVIEQVTWL